MNSFDLDKHIQNRFQLFAGKRSEEEDRKIQDKIYNLVLNELILFTAENTNKEDMEKLTKRLDSEDPREVFVETLNNVPMAKERINARLKYFVDQLLIDSLERQSNK